MNSNSSQHFKDWLRKPSKVQEPAKRMQRRRVNLNRSSAFKDVRYKDVKQTTDTYSENIPTQKAVTTGALQPHRLRE
ncbi:MAG: hypothetical protein WCI87_09150 [Euryarchaeota archaeon]